ncbi:hypothetical protein GTA62_17520 [Roseobacter sp. HKCCD9010]|jgi:hypothetical protein|uniref:hypothetical protein n=1 Tax=Rhodobacterales TaxID=204455 RepID=UPI00119C7D07|nr:MULTISPECIES: hypothetical protein [Rhodobacterales]MBF9051455.1 hypothetical protein [Rhodobacterales bacterium HKCCD4356]NNV12979.1 hypothetical protein [Roseobacter sp. HKCCD7357]NNV17230.1 hypothetical protein [Roseobacter sp. HKCCD8768]NNV26836.1 hypothetical protein [Roseobacter sp. HKCCD8192]NNV30956.1 hypothetical protein [Roseobacter sp. HKCCD9061]
MDDEVIAAIEPKTARRYVATGILGLLGMMLLYIAAATPPADLGWLVFLIVLGAAMLYLSWKLWEASSITLELTRAELREADGTVLARIDNIASVDRGFFAFKPASGFIIRLKEPDSGVYKPGLWWRYKRTILVGGVTSRAQSKSVADLIRVLLVQRDQDS